MSSDDYMMVGISKAPDDPEEKKKWVKGMLRIQIALWIDDGATCEMCGHQYETIDDFIDRNVKWGGIEKFVCGNCWDLYEQLALSESS